VLNHTRVHVYYKDKTLSLRLQQTSLGERGEWLSCFEMKDVTLPMNPYFGVSAATGDLVDNHDIIQFTVQSLDGVQDPVAHHQAWTDAQDAQDRATLEEFDLRPAEATQRDYVRVLRAQAHAIKTLSADVDKLKQSIEFQVATITTGLSVTKTNVDNKNDDLREVVQKMDKAEEAEEKAKEQVKSVEVMKEEIRQEMSQAGSGWRWPFFVLLFLFVGLAGVGYNRYQKIMKSHLL